MNLGNMYDPVPTPYDKPPQIAAQGQAMLNTGPAANSVGKWDQFLQKLSTDQSLQQSLIQAGLQMMTPKGPGENAANKVLQGTDVGFRGYQERERAQLENKRIGAVTREVDAAATGRESSNRVNQATEQDAITTRQNEAIQSGQTTELGKVSVDYARPNAEQDLAEGQSRIGVNNASTQAQYSGINVDNAQIDQIRQETENMKNYPTNGQRLGPNQLLARSMADSMAITQGLDATAQERVYQDWVAKLTTQSKYKNPELVRMEMMTEAGVYQMPERTEAQREMKQRTIAEIESGVQAYTQSVQGGVPSGQPTTTPGGSTGLSAGDAAAREASITKAMATHGLTRQQAERIYDAKMAEMRGQQ